MAIIRREFAAYNAPKGLSTAYYEYDGVTNKISEMGVTGLPTADRCRLELTTDADGVKRESTLSQSAGVNLLLLNLEMTESAKAGEVGKIILAGRIAAEWQAG